MPEADALDPLRLTVCLTPHGRLRLVPADDAPALDPSVAERLATAFARGPGHGLLRLGAGELGRALPPVFAWWREFGGRWVTALCNQPGLDDGPPVLPAPRSDELAGLAAAAPPMPGAEYLTAEVLLGLWTELGRAFLAEHSEASTTVAEFLKRFDPAWNVVGRVHFHLAENRQDERAPFAFLATYTGRLSAQGKAQHLPLGQALREHAGATHRDLLLALLLPVQRAAERCEWLQRMVAAGEIFHPLRWTPAEAFRFLRDVPVLEQAGVVVRTPAVWRAGRPPRPQVNVTVGGKAPGGIGRDALLDFKVEVALEGEPLSPAELRTILRSTDGLALIRGRWVEVDRERLGRVLDRFTEAERRAASEGISFAEALRLLSGTGITDDAPADRADADWSRLAAGPWLADTLRALRSPEALAAVEPGPELRGTLRPYQQVGVRWLHLLSHLGLGACLADDMGLGKTIQVLALLLVQRREAAAKHRPSLLVVPASLLANWASEIDRFAPSLAAVLAHPAFLPPDEWKAFGPRQIAAQDLVITSYGALRRLPALAETAWRLVILDEAQAIKNPQAQQTRAAKKLQAQARIVLTGTPVENRLGDLWSILDFLNPGLLGSAREFTRYAKQLAETPGSSFGPLRELVRPYILRRLKTDRSVISDLPAKTEVKTWCPLTRRQAALYQQAVEELGEQLEEVHGIARKGAVLAFLMRFKQICNHPSQWLGDGAWAEADSGKWQRLRELAETISARQEKALVFTQFREMAGPLAAFLGGVFGRPGLVLTGETPVKQRREAVRRFQEDETIPFFVLSLKAGGSGLNLTAASHVIHVDRWWNPAVENQATDRAFRIGQTRNVLVHKFVCRGTVEEKIDRLIESKKRLAEQLLEGGAEIRLTELSDAELLKLVSLDLRSVSTEE